MNENRIQMAKTLFYIYFALYIFAIKRVYVFAMSNGLYARTGGIYTS